MKNVAVCGLVFALFLLPMVMPKALADDTAPKAKILHREHSTHKQRARRIGHRPKKSGNKGFLEGLTAEERQVDKEQREDWREERRSLLQEQHEGKLEEQKNIQEQKLKLREYHKRQRRNTVKKAEQELQPELMEGPAQQGREAMHQGAHEGQHH